MNVLICLPKSPIASLTGQPDQCILYRVPLCCGAGRNSHAGWNSCAGGLWGSYTWESPGLWAIKICLEMRCPLTLCTFTRSCNPELLLQCHLLSLQNKAIFKAQLICLLRDFSRPVSILFYLFLNFCGYITVMYIYGDIYVSP